MQVPSHIKSDIIIFSCHHGMMTTDQLSLRLNYHSRQRVSNHVLQGMGEIPLRRPHPS